jgi:hypothetical protein
LPLASDNEGSDRTLGRIAVDRQVTGLGVTHQFDPVADQVADGFALCFLRLDKLPLRMCPTA